MFYLEDDRGTPVDIGDVLYRETTDDSGEVIDWWYCKLIMDNSYQVRLDLLRGTHWSSKDENLSRYVKDDRLIGWTKV